MKTQRIVMVATGLTTPVLAYVAIHILFPSGAPEQLTDAELIAAAASGPRMIWAGGALALVAAMFLVIWASLLSLRLEERACPAWLTRAASGAVTLVAGLVALGGVLQVLVGIVSTPAEAFASESFVPVVTLLYGHINLFAWCLLAPAAFAVVASQSPRAVRILSGTLGVILLATVALPPISWLFGFLFLITASLGLARPRGEALTAESASSRTRVPLSA